MNKETRYLSQLSDGERGRVVCITTGGGMRRRLLDLGLIPGTEVICLGKSPFGDPAAYLIRGKTIAIRARDARGVVIG